MMGKTVLVIEAGSETEQIITSTLESQGYLVFAVPGGDVGVEMAQKVSPSLIFINPDEAGLKLCETIRGVESLQKVPLILLVSPGGKTDLGACAAFADIDILNIPCTPAELLEITAKVSSRKAPIVLRVKEKKPEAQSEEAGKPEPLEELVTEQASSAKAAIPEKLGTAETKEQPHGESVSGMMESPGAPKIYIPKKVSRRRKKKSNAPVVVAGLAIIIVCVAGVLFFRPALETKKGVSSKPPIAAIKPKAGASAPPMQPPASSNEPSKQQAAAEDKNLPAATGKAASAQPPAMPSAAGGEITSPSSGAEPATSADSKHAGKAVYSVQLGVFRSEANATALTKEFTAKGYNAFMVKSADKSKGALYRVLIGKSGDRKESAKLAAEVREKENIEAVIYAGQESQP